MPRFVPSCSAVKSFRQSVSTAWSFVVTSPTDQTVLLKVNPHDMKATATKKDFTVKGYVTVEVADTNVCVNRSICCHRTHCLRQEKNVVVTDVTPCQLAFRPIHETKPFRVWTFLQPVPRWSCVFRSGTAKIWSKKNANTGTTCERTLSHWHRYPSRPLWTGLNQRKKKEKKNLRKLNSATHQPNN